MNFFSAVKLICLLLGIVALTMLFPAIVALIYSETVAIRAFFLPIGFCLLLSSFTNIIIPKTKINLSVKSSFVIVASCWIFASLLGAVPFYLGGYTNFINAFFESVSGFTTTGTTIFKDVESLPRSINLWRCQTHWLGGMGIVALTVALLPLIGVGGFQLIKAETTGPEKGKITPKVTMTAKILWFIYMGMTIVQTILLMFFGKMDFIDAISHAFSTLGTGGFSTKNASVEAYNLPVVEWIIAVFMLLAGVNFSLFYYAFFKRGKEIFENSELKAYLGIIFLFTMGITISNINKYPFFESLRYGFFQVVSFITTTGFSTTDYEKWLPVSQMFLFILMFIGGMSGSTAGGIKVVRWVVLGKQVKNEVKKILHPNGVFTIQMNGRAGRKDIVFNVASFIFLYAVLVIVTAFIAALDGVDVITALTSSLTMVGNIGPGFSGVGPSVGNMAFYSPLVKIWFCFAMLAGRLELYTMLIFFMPSFWKK